MKKNITDSIGCWLADILFGHQFLVLLFASAPYNHLLIDSYISI